MSAIVMLLFAAGCLAAADGSATSRSAEPPLTGKPFLRALEQPFAATFENVDLRTIAARVTRARRTAIVIDRRLDPTRTRSIEASGDPLRDFLDRQAATAGGRACVVGSTVYLGPEQAAKKLRTLIALRQQELLGDGSEVPRQRRQSLEHTATISWSDLDEPSVIVRRIGDERGLDIEGLDQIPYDLWGAAQLPEATAIETLSTVLIQYELTFEWINRAGGIRIVPAPEHVVIERRHHAPRGTTAASALKRWKAEFPTIDGRISGNEIVVAATIEQHEAIERGDRGNVAQGERPATPALKPLRLERYTLRIKDAPASALFRRLAEPAYGQLSFEYDAKALSQAGIDLDRRITVEVRRATVDELLKAVLDPLGLKFELVDRTVRLSPAP